MREYIQLERQQTTISIDHDDNGKKTETSQKPNSNPEITTFVLSSFVGHDDVINTCLADDKYPAVEITNNCNVILALREAEEGADVSKHYPVLENRADRMMVLKPNQRIPFVPAKFKANFPKLANPVEFNCQLALYTPSGGGGEGVELSKPVKIHVDGSNITTLTSTPFLREEEVYVPSFGHVYLTMTQRNAQLFVSISSSANTKNRGVDIKTSTTTSLTRTGMDAVPSFNVKLSSVDVILIDRVNSANPKLTDAIFSVSASQLRVLHTKITNTTSDCTNAGSNGSSDISTKPQMTDNKESEASGVKESPNLKESPNTSKLPNINRKTSSPTTTTSELLISLGNVQIDNQIHDDIRFHFPVILLPMRNIAQRYHTATDHAPFADLQASDDIDFLTLRCLVTSSPSLVSIDDVTLDLQPFEMFLEDVFVYKLLEMSKRYLPKLKNSKNCGDNADRLASIKPVLYPIRVCRFRISEIQFLLSIHASVKVFLAADHMPLKLGAFQCQPTQTVGDEFARAVLYHYATQVLVRAGWIVGSFELIGNPTGFIHKMGQGISDFVMMPYHGLTRGPTAFVTGISQGLSSFVRHASTGTLTSITNVSSSISRNLDRLCLDETHMRLQEERRAQVPMQTMSGICLES